MNRCAWVTQDPLYQEYHDTEWGVPLHDDQKLFELLILEGMQAGLNWLLVLKKRQHFQDVFDGFDAQKIVQYDKKKIASLLADPGIIRNRRKILSVIQNAKVFLDIQKNEGGFDSYLWRFIGGKSIQNEWGKISDVPCETAVSRAIGKDLKKRGGNFCGETIMYSFMQAVGMVNDHTVDCFRWKEIQEL